ncbi:hypothetical protein K443DRAFT_136660 [Laccaria amethystina LaAM-08-1]|uniref:Uncharacterized protein n=1 Tax=Laccaria amethystina LaAM-08-1 TaxID=1095629 RepID=A0A0C9Y7Q1_9AGAR|nr:hypothetical protein K443DRAFT_136660 [Laccaria amethystina LaAM-08-1]
MGPILHLTLIYCEESMIRWESFFKCSVIKPYNHYRRQSQSLTEEFFVFEFGDKTTFQRRIDVLNSANTLSDVPLNRRERFSGSS